MKGNFHFLNRLWALIVLLALLPTPCLAVQQSATITLISGDQQTGTWQTTSQEAVILNRGEVDISVPLEQLAELKTDRPIVPSANQATFHLIRGSQALLSRWTADRQSLEGLDSLGDKLQFASDQIQWICQPSIDPNTWQSALETAGRESDAVVVLKDGKLDWIDVVIRRFSNQEVEFSFQGREAKVPWQKIAGLVFFHPPLNEAASETSTVFDTSGQRWVVRRWEWQDQLLKLTSAEGVSLNRKPDQIARWSFADLRFLSLSARPPEQFTWRPLVPLGELSTSLSNWNAPRRNQSFEDSIIRIVKPMDAESTATEASQAILDLLQSESSDKPAAQWTEYPEGLALKVGSTVTYQLEQRFEKLTGVVGLAPPLDRNRAAEVRILADREIVFDQKLSARERPSAQIDVTLANPNRLEIQIQFAEDKTPGDVVHFGNLRLLK